MIKMTGVSHLDAVQERIEQRTEPYLNTVKGVAQILPQQCARSAKLISSLAGDSDCAVRRS